jgi:glycosyltransferase involved in cell wall biosynthesis
MADHLVAPESDYGVRVVIAHDFIETFGGAERVVQEMARTFPDAPVVTILGRQSVAVRMGIADRVHSLLPESRLMLRHYRLLAPLFPSLVRGWRLPEADVLLTSSYAFAHGFRTRNDAFHICYCHSPLRFAWTMTDAYKRIWARNAISAHAFDALAALMRAADRRASRRVGHFLTQSDYTAAQIRQFFGREAEVIGVPVDPGLFRPSTDAVGDYFLLCGRLVEPYKAATIVVKAFEGLGERLIVAGDGPALPRLRKLARSNVQFVGHLGDEELVRLMQRCRAAIFPSRDDFGLVPLEVMSCGRPVIAYAAGGALHTVVPGLSGELFETQRPDAVAEAVRRFDPAGYDSDRIRMHAEQWLARHFRERLINAVMRAVERPPISAYPV